MILDKLSILNYRNIEELNVEWCDGVNCLIGRNGVGKSNILDAIHYLSFCRSSFTPVDAQNIRHGAPYFMIEGHYTSDDGTPEHISCGMKAGGRKRFKRNGKEYRRLSQHIGLVPIVSVAPADTLLIDGGGEERRRLMDMVVAQYDPPYIEALSRYGKALQQRNTLLKGEAMPDEALMDVLEEEMAARGEYIYQRRQDFVGRLVPIFQRYYALISDGREQVGVDYRSHCQRGPLLEVIRRDRARDRAVGYSLHGVHRDDLDFSLSSHPMKRYGSQGQTKTFAIALKLAQFDFLRHAASHATPLLLLDDIFDKLDAQRVERIVEIVAGEGFGQIFVTDTNRSHLNTILANATRHYRLFDVEQMTAQPSAPSNPDIPPTDGL